MATSDDELVAEIRRLEEELEHVPRQKDIRERSEHPLSAFRRAFGSWNDAVREAGFKPYPERRRISEEELVDALHELAEEVDGPPSAEQMTAYGEYSHAVYIDRFGSWSAALREAGFTPPERNAAPERGDLVAELARLADDLGRVPSSSDVDEHGEYAYSAYYREFDSFADALKAADLL